MICGEINGHDITEPPDHDECGEAMEPKYIQFNEINHMTSKAVLFKNDEGEFWVPKSILTIDYKNTSIEVPEYFSPTYLGNAPTFDLSQKIKFNSIVHKTSKAILISDINGNFWVPNSICEIDGDTLSVPDYFKANYVE